MPEIPSKSSNLAFILLIILLLGLAYYVGLLQGKRGGAEAVVLACSEDTLSQLSVPTGALSGKSEPKFKLPIPDLTASATPQAEAKGKYVGSKNGTKYYLPTCSTVKRIKPENYVWFDSVEDATLQGYSAGKC